MQIIPLPNISLKASNNGCRPNSPARQNPFPKTVAMLTDPAERYAQAFKQRTTASKDRRLLRLICDAPKYPSDRAIIEDAIKNLSFYDVHGLDAYSSTISLALSKPLSPHGVPSDQEIRAFLKLMLLHAKISQCEQKSLEKALKHWEFIALYLAFLGSDLKKAQGNQTTQMQSFASKVDIFPAFADTIYSAIGECSDALRLEGFQVFAKSPKPETWSRLCAARIVSHLSPEIGSQVLLKIFSDISEGIVDKTFTRNVREEAMCDTLHKYLQCIAADKKDEVIQSLSQSPAFSEKTQMDLKALLNQANCE